MKKNTLRSQVLAALLGVLLAPTLPAQDDNLTFTLNFREDTDLQTVIEVVADATGRTIIPDPRARGAQVRFYNQESMTANELWDVFLQILQTHGYGAVEVNGIWRVVPIASIRTEVSPELGAGAEFVTETIDVENLNASQLVPLLRPMIATEAHIGAVVGSNTLIVVDRAANVRRVREVIEAMDSSSAPVVELVPLQFASAEDVTQKISSLIQAQAGAGGVSTLQAIADERTNSVILTGTANLIARYRAIAESLDTPSNQGGGSQVRYLNYADAEEVATSLQSMFGGTQVVEDAETAADPTGGNVNIVADVGTNSLIMRAPSVVLQDMLTIVAALDIPRAQVHIQAIIVEMTENRAAELGLTWAVDGAGGDQAAVLTNFSAVGGGILQLAQIGAGGVPNPGAIGDGVTAAIGDLNDSGTSWAAVVSALQGDGQTNVLQLPELVVLDNEEATINVGQEVPFVTGQYTNTGQGGGGAVNPFQTTQREPVGTTLTITPRINEGTGMRLTIYQEVSSISASAIASDVITNQRVIETEVFVNDGNILVLGGLMDDLLRESEQRVPGLGSIPGLRWLFRARSAERTNTQLMVFIRPTILRDSIDAAQMTGAKYRYLQEQERLRADEPVPLMRDVERPSLPPFGTDPTAEELPPFDAPPPADELRPLPAPE